MISQRSGLLDTLVALFEAVWDRAWPPRADLSTVDSDPMLEEPDQKIPRLLLAGLTDRSGASQLNLTMRARLQLGWRVARSGWL